jgi:hypothetical protein
LFSHHFHEFSCVGTSAISIHPKAFCEHLKVVAENRFIYTNLTQQHNSGAMAMASA